MISVGRNTEIEVKLSPAVEDMTPSMEAGISDHVWSLEGIARLAE